LNLSFATFTLFSRGRSPGSAFDHMR
jgi:hypothetical protein